MATRWWAPFVALVLMATACSSSPAEPPGDLASPNQPDPSTSSTSTSPTTVGDRAEPAARSARLDNGLQVEITPVAGSSASAVLLVHGVGANQDPVGQSGLAHFVEHFLATAATSAERARTVEEFVAAYPLGWNAQTGAGFTVYATVVEPDALGSELALTAARLRGIQPTDTDVGRERPRILQEVDNMFGGLPTLAAANIARERLLPSPEGGRRGGRPEALAAITLDDVVRRLEIYNPSNATLSIAGALDADATMDLVTGHFADLPAGPPAPPPVPYDEGPGDPMARRSDPSTGVAAVSHVAPSPADSLYPPFLVAVGRLYAAGQVSDLATSFGPLDTPDSVAITSPVRSDEDASAAVTRMRNEVTELLSEPLTDRDVDQALAAFGPLLGWTTTPGNPYAVALSAAVRPHLAIDPDRIAADLRRVDDAAYRDAVDRIFVTGPTAAASAGP